MEENKSPPSAPLLDYATPVVRRTRPIMGAIAVASGVSIGLFSLLPLGFGIYGLIIMFIIRPKDTGDSISGDLIPALIVLLVGIICGYVSIRWCKSAISMLRGK